MKKALILLGIGVTMLQACSSETHDNNNTGSFTVTSPFTCDTVYAIDYVANLQSVFYVELRARVKGYIESINTDEGKPVKKDQILFSISNQEYKEELVKAKAAFRMLQSNLKTQELEVKSLKALVDKGVISTTDLEKAVAESEAIKAHMDAAQADIAEAEINLARTVIRAPFDGVIDLIPNKVGSLIDEGTLLSTVTNNTEIFAYFNVSEKEYLDHFSKINMNGNEKVTLVLANNEPHSSPGIIETVNGRMEKSTGSLTIRARFPNPQQLVKHGSTGKVRVYIPAKKALIIPQKSTFEIQEKNYVYVVNKEGVIEKRSFVPKFRLPNLYIIESGLSETDKIVYEGVQYLKEGDKINPQFTAIKNLLSNIK